MIKLNPTLPAGLMLLLFAMLGAGLVAFTFDNTREQIRENERIAILRNLNELVPRESHDNDILKDTIEVWEPSLLGTTEAVIGYRARFDDQPVAVVLTPIAPDGYSGKIKLLVGIHYDGTLAGVRVVNHRETPGLGDAIEVERSDWIRYFAGLSLSKPPLERWGVKRDGGDFDQFTGATITPRAVVRAVKNALLYYAGHRDELFAPPPATDVADVTE